MRAILLGLCLLPAVVIVGWVLINCRRGFEFTDEGFYLVWIANPFRYDWSLSQFGFVYHPLYVLLGGNVALLRQANVFITVGLGWALARAFLGTVLFPAREAKAEMAVLAVAMSVIPLIQMKLWLPSPNYNTLALQALMIAVLGVLLIRGDAERDIGWILTAIGGAFAFFAKPSTAAALACWVGVYLLCARKLRWRGVAVAMASVALIFVLTALLIDGSLSGFVSRIRIALDFFSHFGSGHTFSNALRFDRFWLSSPDKLFLCLAATLTAVTAFLLCSDSSLLRWLAAAVLTIAAMGFIAVIQLPSLRVLPSNPFQALLILFCVAAALAFGVMRWRLQALLVQPVSHWALVALFLGMSYAYVFGSNTNYWDSGSSSGVFLFYAGLTLLAPFLPVRRDWPVLVPFIVVGHGVLIILLRSAIELPYRQTEPLWLNAQSIDLGRPGSRLQISERFASYIRTASGAAADAGFRPTDPLIDLSGRSPGLLYALNATSVGSAWIGGGYSGSQKVAELGLGRVPCDTLARSWILTEPSGPGSISVETIAVFGAAVPRDYEVAASWDTAVGASSYPKSYTQLLLRPTRSHSDAVQACETARIRR